MTSQPPLFDLEGESNDPGGFLDENYTTPPENDYFQAPTFEGPGCPGYTYPSTGPFSGTSESGPDDRGRTAPAANDNKSDSYDIPITGIGPEPRFWQQLDSSFVRGNELNLVRGIDTREDAEANSQSLERRAAGVASRYHHSHLSKSTIAGNILPSLQTTYFTVDAMDTASQDVKGATTAFAHFEGKFQDSESAKEFRKIQTRGKRMPYRAPDSDSTIADIESNRSYHVERIYNAMTRGDKARDNERSIAMKRWVHGAYYKSHLVEAYCHKVLDCLLEQAKKGYRGWEHNDYVADDRKGEDEDRNVDCAARLENILRALEEEKTICEDVMNSACQIRMFVNAPKAYANRKYQNRVGNSKRGRPKDIDDEATAKASKMRRTPLRPTTRARTSSQLLNRPASHTPEPLQHQPQAQLYLTPTPPTQMSASPNSLPSDSTVSHHSAIFTPAQPSTISTHSMDFISPPSLRNPLRRPTIMTPAQNSPLIQQQAPVPDLLTTSMPTQVMQPSGRPLGTWSSNPTYGLPQDFAVPNPELFPEPDWVLNFGEQANTDLSSNLFEQYPDAASMALLHEPQELGGELSFQDSWLAQQDPRLFSDCQGQEDKKCDQGE